MVLSKTAEKEKPKKPLTQYFLFRDQRLAQMDKDEKNRSKKIKIEYDELDEKEKKALDDKAAELREKYEKDMEKWRTKFGIEEDTKSERKKSKDKNSKKSMSKDKGSKDKDNKSEKGKSKPKKK